MRDPGGVRQANLSALVEIVHRDGPKSRSELTERTGLNRSTIADLVAELTERGLVAETPAETPADSARRVGRPSPIVAASPRTAVVSVNPEVDALTLAVVGLDRGILARARLEVDHLLTPEETVARVAEQHAAWARTLPDVRFVGVGVAVPGLVRSRDGLVRNAPHLRWRDAPLRDLLHRATGLPSVIGNDATLGAIAEHLFGAARGVDDVVYLNGGASGIGGGIIVHGMPVLGAAGYAGEFGQSRARLQDPADARSSGGALEDEVNRARLLAVARLPAGDDTALARALVAGGPDAAAEIARQRRILATALAGVVNMLNPSVIVLGGFLAVLLGERRDELAASVRAQAMAENGEQLEVRPAELTDTRLLIGAAEAAFAPLIADPAGWPPVRD